MKIDTHINRSLMINRMPFEVVERKGLGHPDTICDLMAERISRDLGNYYLISCGRVLHYNVDKALLIAGTSAPQFGGGKCLGPVKLYLGDRAVSSFNGQILPINEVIENSIDSWLNENLRFLRLGSNFQWENEIKPGFKTLDRVEDSRVSNDTSVGVGYWPLSNLEKLTLAIDEFFQTSKYKSLYPELGEDFKILSIRHNSNVEVVLACAFVDKYINGTQEYIQKKNVILNEIKDYTIEKFSHNCNLNFGLNLLDDPSLGLDGLYLTVTGLSCEGGDSGQVGRGNRVSGLISFMRPQTMEAWAGKNFSTHVGKIYSFASQNLARTVCENIEEVSEATITLVGKIGDPVEEPGYVFADCKIKKGSETKIKKKILNTIKKTISEKIIFEPSAVFNQT